LGKIGDICSRLIHHRLFHRSLTNAQWGLKEAIENERGAPTIAHVFCSVLFFFLPFFFISIERDQFLAARIRARNQRAVKVAI
jgi:hypothetical protein